jgi:hypothetical protein
MDIYCIHELEEKSYTHMTGIGSQTELLIYGLRLSAYDIAILL